MDAITYRSSAYDLSSAGEAAYFARLSLKAVKAKAWELGLNDQQTLILVGSWRNAKAAAQVKEAGR
jgi:hypothetical protein